MSLNFLPVAPVVFHVCQVNPLLVVDVDVNFIDDLISLKAVLSDLDLLNHVSGSEPVHHCRVCKLSLGLNIIQPMLCEWKTLLGIAPLASFTLQQIRIRDFAVSR